ncbi:hypothetical protein O0L34_g16423 [Tuta absoluta]|nr:hypothetical protein O0L34_g16423 [Tuta absoluta]
MIILELLILVPKMMATIWALMYYLNTKAYWYSYMTELVFAFHLAIQICTPAIVAEMANSQVDSIKLILKERLLGEKDSRTSASIKHTLELLETKPLNHLVLRFIPIDIRLLLAVFSVCSTYFIVIIQFSHIYD